MRKPVHIDITEDEKKPIRRHNLELPTSPLRTQHKSNLDDLQSRYLYKIGNSYTIVRFWKRYFMIFLTFGVLRKHKHTIVSREISQPLLSFQWYSYCERVLNKFWIKNCTWSWEIFKGNVSVLMSGTCTKFISRSKLFQQHYSVILFFHPASSTLKWPAHRQAAQNCLRIRLL